MEARKRDLYVYESHRQCVTHSTLHATFYGSTMLVCIGYMLALFEVKNYKYRDTNKSKYFT